MRTGIIVAISGLAFLAGCGNMGNDAAKPPAPAKWKPPYLIDFEAKAAEKANPAGVTLPSINYTASTKELERRANLVIRIDSSQAKSDQLTRNQMIMGPVDMPDKAGTLPAAYMNQANEGLAKMLAANCLNGKVKLNIAIVRSSIKPDAGEGELNTKRLTEWTPTEVTYKNPHPKC